MSEREKGEESSTSNHEVALENRSLGEEIETLTNDQPILLSSAPRQCTADFRTAQAAELYAQI